MRRLSDNDIVLNADDRIASSRPAPVRRSRGAPQVKNGNGSYEPAQTPRRKFARPRFKTGLSFKLKLNLLPANMSTLQRLAAKGVAVTALVVGAAVFWHSGVLQRGAANGVAALWRGTSELGFRIEDVTITGRGRTPMEAIAAALVSHHGDPIMAVDIEAVRDRLETIQSVKAAAVERRLPGGIHVALVEREPVAIWQNNGSHILVDRDGHQIPGSIGGYEDLPLVVGDGAGGRADELLNLLAAEPELAPRVRAAVRVGNRRWNLMLDDAKSGMEVRLPEDAPEAAWHRLAEMEKERILTGRKVNMVDLRVPDRMVLKSERPAIADGVKKKDDGV